MSRKHAPPYAWCNKISGIRSSPSPERENPFLVAADPPQQHVNEQGANCSKPRRCLPGSRSHQQKGISRCCTSGEVRDVCSSLSICFYSAHLLSCSWVPLYCLFLSSVFFSRAVEVRDALCFAVTYGALLDLHPTKNKVKMWGARGNHS